MLIQLTSHIHSALVLEWLLHQQGDDIELRMSRILLNLLVFLQHPSAGAVARRPILTS
jgi:hypothetical protein